ncbi:MAG TPA: helix-turn-helix domain-containing protein [Actinopolymorphaceae bacterium]|nr:helix-turn-helix domain-containing protein [Actinopolymorphaceae bacterium]
MSDARWEAVGALVDPVRRALYDFVRHQDHPVTREEAAEARAISRNLAAFHLDKLVAAGLLQAKYQTHTVEPRGRGRLPKVYEPVEDAVIVTIPERRYELVGQILVDAIADDPADAGRSARRRARQRGRRAGQFLADQLGEQRRERLRRLAGSGSLGARELVLVRRALAELGFDPDEDRPQHVVLRNCPFHSLAVQQPELVCGLNLAYLNGLLDGLGTDQVDARLAPRPGHCCVEVGLTSDGDEP